MIESLARDIWKALGPGYSEAVYHTAFEVGLRKQGVPYESERIIPLFYEGLNVGNVRADIVVDGTFVIELKSVARLTEPNRIQIRNYLTLLGLEYGYLINFPTGVGALECEEVRNPSGSPAAPGCLPGPESDTSLAPPLPTL
jgi:GxxExxY protein